MMRGYRTILLASVAALISSTAMANEKVLQVSNSLDELFLEEATDTITVETIESIVTKFEIVQSNNGAIYAHNNAVAAKVDGYTASAIGIANNASVDVQGAAAGGNWQRNSGNVRASVDARVMNGTGATELTAVAIGNNFSFTVEDNSGAVVGSKQSNKGDIAARVHGEFHGHTGEVTTTAVAIANNFSIQTDGGSVMGGVEQINNGNVAAMNHVIFRPVRDSADPAASVAIGNNISISTYAPSAQ